MTQLAPSSTRSCAWCGAALEATLRRDAKFCSQRCRQASHRFGRAVGKAQRASSPMRLAIADPPYPGKAHLYRDHPDYAGEVDHDELIGRLCCDYDGWALATSMEALPLVLSIAVSHAKAVRTAPWIRGGRNCRSAHPNNDWEAVVYWGGRQVVSPRGSRDTSRPGPRDASPPGARDASGAAQHDASREYSGDMSCLPASRKRRSDVLIYTGRARTTDPNRVIGAKPAVWCRWVFDLMGAQIGDSLDDLYPGSGGITRAWRIFTESDRTPTQADLRTI